MTCACCRCMWTRVAHECVKSSCHVRQYRLALTWNERHRAVFEAFHMIFLPSGLLSGRHVLRRCRGLCPATSGCSEFGYLRRRAWNKLQQCVTWRSARASCRFSSETYSSILISASKASTRKAQQLPRLLVALSWQEAMSWSSRSSVSC